MSDIYRTHVMMLRIIIGALIFLIVSAELLMANVTDDLKVDRDRIATVSVCHSVDPFQSAELVEMAPSIAEGGKTKQLVSLLEKSVEYDGEVALKGILGYLVFEDREGKPLFSTKIYLDRGILEIVPCKIVAGRLHLVQERKSAVGSSYRMAPDLVREIFDHLKKTVPEKIGSVNLFGDAGGGK